MADIQTENEVLSSKADPQHIEVIDGTPVALELDSIENTPLGWYTWLISLTASIGGFLFGYDTGIISAVLVYIGDGLGHELSSNEKELITSLCSGGGFVGAIAAGLTADRFGRKGAIFVGCVLFTIGAIIQATSYSLAQMSVGRFVVGLGVGSAAMVVPVYIAEIAPTKMRGRLIGLNNMSITGGQVISYGIGAAFANVSNGWRYMVGLGGVPSLILIGLLQLCPESPRQLIFHNRRDEAKNVLRKIFKNGTDDQLEDKTRLIEWAVQHTQELEGSQSRLYKIKQLHTNPAYFRALVCACGLMAISQFSGFNALMYYSSTLFALVGFSNPVGVGTVVAAGNFIMTFVNMALVDPVGRRRVLICSVWGMAAALVGAAVAFSHIPVDLDTLALEDNRVTTAAIVVLVFLIIFVLFYGVSVGNTAWMSTDFFPMEVRSIGTMYMTCLNWGPNIIVSSTFLTMMKSMTPSGAFGFYAGINALSWVLIIFFYPEVSGLTLEEVGEVFKHGFGVRYASKLRKDRKLVAKGQMERGKDIDDAI